jgi:acetylornithine deacetylase
MKGGLAACMLAGAAAAGAGLAGDVLVAAVSDEEYASVGCRSVAERFGAAADAAIVTEPTALSACVAHRGFAWASIDVRGRAAHGSRPDLGVDAIVHMGAVLAEVADLDRRFSAREPHPLLGRDSVHASLIEGGQELSSYPARCVLSLERRTIPGETADRVRRECEALVEGIEGADARLSLVRDPFSVDPDADVVQAVARAAEAVTGRPAELYGETYWMDAAFIQAAGIPTVVFGPGGEGAHAVEEWVDLESVEACADGLVLAVRDLCR